MIPASLHLPIQPSPSLLSPLSLSVFFLYSTATTDIYTLSLHDALPIYRARAEGVHVVLQRQQLRRVLLGRIDVRRQRSEEHTSELQSPCNLVCRLLLEKKKKQTTNERDAAKHQRSKVLITPLEAMTK